MDCYRLRQGGHFCTLRKFFHGFFIFVHSIADNSNITSFHCHFVLFIETKRGYGRRLSIAIAMSDADCISRSVVTDRWLIFSEFVLFC